MNQSQLYLKTVFCCIACDGEIVESELAVLYEIVHESEDLFKDVDVHQTLVGFLEEIRTRGHAFLKDYLSELTEADLPEDEQLKVLDLCFRSIESDNNITREEMGFFKQVRACLPISDERILEEMPDKEDYLLPDIRQDDYFSFDITWNSLSI